MEMIVSWQPAGSNPAFSTVFNKVHKTQRRPVST